MTNTVQANRFPEFNCASGHQGGDSPQSSTLGSAYTKSGTWDSPSGIWGINGIKNIGSGLSSTARDVSIPRTAGNNDFVDGTSGSGALTVSDPWLSRPWNHTNVASPPTVPPNASISPSHTQNKKASANPHTLLKVQNSYQQQSQQPTRPAFRHSINFSRSQGKNNLDPSSGTFKLARKSTTPYDGKKNRPGQNTSNQNTFDMDYGGRLPLGNSTTRDGPVPVMQQPEISEWGFNSNTNMPTHGNGEAQFGTVGNNTANTFNQSQLHNFSTLPFSLAGHTNLPLVELSPSEVEVSEKIGNLRIGNNSEQISSLNKSVGSCFSPQNPHFPIQSFPFLEDSFMWSEGVKPMNLYDSYWSQPWANPMYINKVQRYPEKVPIPFSGTENRRGLNGSKYRSRPASAVSISPSQTAPNGPRTHQGPSHLERKQSTAQAQSYVLGSQLQSQAPIQLYEYLPNTLRSGFPYNHTMLMQSYSPLPTIPNRLGKDHDVGAGVRSLLLEEFRANTKFNKRYELKDIYHHVVEFSGDQHGSRFIQTKLETANSDEKEQVFREIQPNALQLMTDVFGNYVIQKLFEHGNQVQKRVLAEQMKNHVMELSLQMYGCRVVQKALEHVLADQQALLVDELQVDVLKCVKDQNGNHVIQKAIERIPSQHIQFIIDAFRGQIETLATHPYGCRVIQRILEFCKPHDQVNILRELHECSQSLITDQYGNYVTQHVIQHGKPEDREKIINLVIGQLLSLSKHKFASNVVEKSIIYGTEQQRRAMASLLTATNSDGTNSLQQMMKDQFGNYVIQKLIAQLQGVEKAAFLNDMKPQLLLLKKYNYGKQISVIEKLLFSASQLSQSITDPTQPKDALTTQNNSQTSSPLLQDAQKTPESSCMADDNDSSIIDQVEPCENLLFKNISCPKVA
ncbi:Pumilio 2 [Podosphaera aphanis]|nr:Pumilio 2 [Podosphaera aphanis]